MSGNGNTALVTREQERATATTLYGEDGDIKKMIQDIRTVAPWVHNDNPKLKFSDNEVALVARRAMAMGLDPLNPHEVQIWKDNRGAVNFQISYTLMAEWVRQFKGTHTEPQYHRLTEEELKEQGLQKVDVAYRCSFVMDSSLDKLMLLAELYGPQEAKKMVEVSGMGMATAQEYGGQYFAPAGRSRTWKVQKRALVDAYRRKFGTPTRAEIEELRRRGGFEAVDTGDWEAPENLDARSRAALAKDTAFHRQHQERLATDPEYKAEFVERSDAAISAMYGEDAVMPAAVEGDYREAQDDNPGPDFEDGSPEQPAEAPRQQIDTTPVRPYDPWTLGTLIEESVEKRRANGNVLGPRLNNFKKAVISNIESCFDQHKDQARHVVTEYLVKKGSSKDWDDFETQALHGWLGAAEQDGVWVVGEHVKAEAHAVDKEAMATKGQQSLF
jgi:hypothetical protein